MPTLTRLPFILVITLAFCHLAHAEEGVLWVQVSNPLGQPLPGVVLSASGPSSTSPPTANNGLTRILLANDTRPGQEVELVIVRAPQNMVFISPWDRYVTVPCFGNDSKCRAKIVLAERGSRMLLEYPEVGLALVSNVNAANRLKVGTEPLTEEQRRANLAEVAKAFGFSPEEVDRAISTLGGKATDPSELGEVALYKRNYPEAEKHLLKSKVERSAKLEKAKGELADVSFLLGQTYYEQGKYREAITEYREAAGLRPDDVNIRNNLCRSLHRAGQYGKAEECYRQSLSIREKALGSEHPDVADILNNLALLYTEQGSYAEAEPLHKRALAISEKHFGPEHPNVATSLHNLALLYSEQDKDDEAEPLYKRAIAIKEKHLGHEHLSVANSVDNLGNIYTDQGKYGEAEPLYKRALVIREKRLGPEHPDVATSLNNLAALYYELGKHVEAEPLYKRAITIREKHLGTEHPDLAVSLHNLANLYMAQGRYEETEALFKRALVIFEKHLGPEHTNLVIVFRRYAASLRKMNRTAEAEAMETRAAAIQAKQK